MNVQGLMESEMCVMDGAKSMLKDNIVYHIIFMLKKKRKKKDLVSLGLVDPPVLVRIKLKPCFHINYKKTKIIYKYWMKKLER